MLLRKLACFQVDTQQVLNLFKSQICWVVLVLTSFKASQTCAADHVDRSWAWLLQSNFWHHIKWDLIFSSPNRLPCLVVIPSYKTWISGVVAHILLLKTSRPNLNQVSSYQDDLVAYSLRKAGRLLELALDEWPGRCRRRRRWCRHVVGLVVLQVDDRRELIRLSGLLERVEELQAGLVYARYPVEGVIVPPQPRLNDHSWQLLVKRIIPTKAATTPVLSNYEISIATCAYLWNQALLCWMRG